ncbi:MAG: hypothetical protein ACRBCT_08800 [Alphaproteobacteria bacterium]
MAQGDRAKRLREEMAAAAAVGQAPLTEGLNAGDPQKALSSLVTEIQAEISAGRYEKPATILSSMLSSEIEPSKLKQLIDASAGNGTYGMAPETLRVGTINGELRKINPEISSLTVADMRNIANIGSLPHDEFLTTLAKLVPADGMEVLYNLASASDKAPDSSSALDAAVSVAPPPAQKATDTDPDEAFSLLSYMTNPSYQEAWNGKIFMMLANFEEMATNMLSGTNDMSRMMGSFLFSMLDIIKPIIGSIGGIDFNAQPAPEPDPVPQPDPAATLTS